MSLWMQRKVISLPVLESPVWRPPAWDSPEDRGAQAHWGGKESVAGQGRPEGCHWTQAAAGPQPWPELPAERYTARWHHTLHWDPPKDRKHHVNSISGTFELTFYRELLSGTKCSCFAPIVVRAGESWDKEAYTKRSPSHGVYTMTRLSPFRLGTHFPINSPHWAHCTFSGSKGQMDRLKSLRWSWAINWQTIHE